MKSPYVNLKTSADGRSTAKESAALQEPQETQVRALGQEDPPEEGTAIHFSILSWRIHGQRSPVGYSP